jgi:hypothetical protein
MLPMERRRRDTSTLKRLVMIQLAPRRTPKLLRIASWLCVLSLLTALAAPNLFAAKKAEPGQTPAGASESGPMEGVSAPGMVRIGDTQILYGISPVPCDSPSEVCQVEVKFQAPFAEQPVVTLTSLANAQTQKLGVACLLHEKLSVNGFTARVILQANVKELKRIPWMAIGRWR